MAAILLWIGGVGFVTTVLIPALASIDPAERMQRFHAAEQRFAPQARIWVMLAGLRGLWMMASADLWWRLSDLHDWWMLAGLSGLWAVFATILFVIEPLAIHPRINKDGGSVCDFCPVAANAQHLVWLEPGDINRRRRR